MSVTEQRVEDNKAAFALLAYIFDRANRKGYLGDSNNAGNYIENMPNAPDSHTFIMLYATTLNYQEQEHTQDDLIGMFDVEQREDLNWGFKIAPEQMNSVLRNYNITITRLRSALERLDALQFDFETSGNFKKPFYQLFRSPKGLLIGLQPLFNLEDLSDDLRMPMSTLLQFIHHKETFLENMKSSILLFHTYRRSLNLAYTDLNRSKRLVTSLEAEIAALTTEKMNLVNVTRRLEDRFEEYKSDMQEIQRLLTNTAKIEGKVESLGRILEKYNEIFRNESGLPIIL